MHVTDTQITLESQHALEKTSIHTAKLERAGESGDIHLFSNRLEEELNRLIEARRQDDTMPEPVRCCLGSERLHDMLETMLAVLFGLPSTYTASQSGSAVPTQTGASSRRFWQITETERVSETESCRFSASGKVCLADGSEQQFDIGYALERSEEINRVFNRTLFDPLVLDRAASGPGLPGKDVQFDLNNDGNLEWMRLPDAGSAFLFIDRNHNGRPDNGSELFGPETGNGFAELARLDSDRNGWIDGADSAFSDLALWQAGDQGPCVQRLDEAGIGALATVSAITPFELKENGERIGQARSSSIWLGETGGGGVVRQVDIATAPTRAGKG